MQLIDAKGLACPQPVILAKKQIDAGASAFVVQVDNRTAVENLRRLAESQHYTFTESGADGVYSLTFSRGDVPAVAPAMPAASQTTGSWAVFAGSEYLGAGDPELGAALIKMYFYTLSQGDDLPASILLMNGGVKLASENEQVAEHLRALIARGCEVLVCGTCLNFYHLAEKLQAGQVSNMFEITEAMRRATKVVSL